MVARASSRCAARRRAAVSRRLLGHPGHAGDGVRRRRAAGRSRRCSTRSTSRARARPCARWPRRRSRWCCSATPRASTSAQLRREVGVPLRLLGIGLPLTIALGALAAALVFGQLTHRGGGDPGGRPRADRRRARPGGRHRAARPGRIRQGLNVESGLNDGICVPLLFAAVAVADVESEISGGPQRRDAPARGDRLRRRSAASSAGSWSRAIVVHAGRRDLIAGAWRQVIPAAGAALAYGTASALGGLGLHRGVRRGHDLPRWRSGAIPGTSTRSPSRWATSSTASPSCSSGRSCSARRSAS